MGFEALYWIPFLRKLGIAPEQLIPVTRGGAHVWYPATRYVELYDLRTPKQIRIENLLNIQREKKLKQVSWTDFDRAVIADAAKALGLDAYLTLHPSWMYRLLDPFWMQAQGVAQLLEHVDIHSYPHIVIDGIQWPEHFVAVRFYARSTFPLNEATLIVARETVKHLAQQQPVVLLNTGLHVDDHVDLDLRPLPNVYKLTDLTTVTAQNSLAVQSAALSQSVGFVGTYGGLSQLALLHKKPSVSLYQEWQGTMIAHKHLADTIATHMGVMCQVLKLTEIPLLRAILPAIQIQVQTSSGARQAMPA